MQEISATDDPEAHILQLDLLSAADRSCQRWVVGELHWRARRPYPVFGMTGPSGTGEASCFELGTGE